MAVPLPVETSISPSPLVLAYGLRVLAVTVTEFVPWGTTAEYEIISG